MVIMSGEMALLSHKLQYSTVFNLQLQHLEMLWPVPLRCRRISADIRNACHSQKVCVQVILLAELVCDGDAGQVFAPVTLDRVDVEEDGKGGQKT